MGTLALVVLQGGQGNDDLDGNNGVIDFNFRLMMMLEATGIKGLKWIVAMTMMVVSTLFTILFYYLMKVVILSN